jgi:hypothetical protein
MVRFGPLVLTLCAAVAVPTLITAQQNGLKIVVVEGEDAVNIIQQKTATAPVVEVRDRNDLPIAGVPVTFSISSGGATFGGAQTLTVVTNAAGRAVAAGLAPTSNGALQIAASAAFQGQTAVATIAQTNVMTAAQAATATAGTAAASSTGAGASSGGLSNVAVAGLAGGAGAGALVAVVAARSDETPSDQQPLSVNVSPSGTGIRDVTSFLFTVTGGGTGTAYSWDFGDGTTAAGSSVTHTFSTNGVLQPVVTSTSASAPSQRGTVSVTVGDVNGTWDSPTSDGVAVYRLVIRQQQNTLSGDFIVICFAPTSPSGVGCVADTSALSGIAVTPRGITISQAGQCRRTFDAAVDPDLKAIRAVVSSLRVANPSCNPNESMGVPFTRQ